MNHVKVSIPIKDTAHSEMLIAILAMEGYDGFEESETELRAFITEEKFDATVLAAMKLPFHLEYKTEVIAQQNWNAQWESSFEPVIVNNFAVIRASFHQTHPDINHEIIITPKMSFGTGHHATTYMMIEQMAKLDFTGKKVIDFGTGTAVLAILAEKMGAASILAIDNDDWSIENSKENIVANGCTKISIEKAAAIPADQQFNIILANINLNVIVAAMDKLCAASPELLLSGFLFSDEEKITRELATQNKRVVNVKRNKDWICIHAINS